MFVWGALARRHVLGCEIIRADEVLVFLMLCSASAFRGSRVAAAAAFDVISTHP